MSLDFGALFSNPLIAIGILAGLGIIALLYYWQSGRGKGKDTEGVSAGGDVIPANGIPATGKKQAKGNIPVRIADNITAMIFNTFISPEAAKEVIGIYGTLGRQWEREGKKIYALNRYKDDKDGQVKLRPIVISSQITNAPAELHYDLQQPEVGIVISEMLKDDDKPFLEKYGKVLWWIAVMGFLAFMWSQS